MPGDDRALLDWNLWYAPGAARPASDNLFLADAVHIAGKALCLPYDHDFPLLAGMPEPPEIEIPDEDAAFDGDVPIPEVHAAFGDAIRAVLRESDPRTRRRAALLRALWPDRWELLANSLTADPEIDLDGPLTREQWGDALDEIESQIHLGGAARIAMRVIADAITHLAFRGEIKTLCRPATGAFDEQPLDPSVWRTTTPLWRLASCSINLDAPFDPRATPTHHIFVARAGLRPALAKRALTHAVALNSEGALSTDPVMKETFPDAEREATEMLDRIIATDPQRRWRRPKLKELLAAECDRIDTTHFKDSIFETARSRLLDKYPQLEEGGAGTGPRLNSAERPG